MHSAYLIVPVTIIWSINYRILGGNKIVNRYLYDPDLSCHYFTNGPNIETCWSEIKILSQPQFVSDNKLILGVVKIKTLPEILFYQEIIITSYLLSD